MKKRPAIRLINKLYSSRQININWHQELEDRGYTWRFNNTKREYTFVVKQNGTTLASRGICAFRCIKELALQVVNIATFQGQPVNMDAKRTAAKFDFIANLKEQQCDAFPIVAAPNYGSISFLKKFTPHPDVEEAIEKTLDSELVTDAMREEVNNYMHSSEITDASLITPAFNKLATRPEKPMNRALLKRMIIINILSQRTAGGKLVTAPVEYSPGKMAGFEKNSGSASGILTLKPVDKVCGMLQGSKGDMHVGAVKINIRDRIVDTVPAAIPFKPFLKSEVVKRGKAVRGIQNESYANYIALAMASKPERLYDKGIAIGMGKLGEGLQMIFMYWFVIFKNETGGTWSEFLTFLVKQGAHESDKTSWESSTNVTDGFAYLFCEVNSKEFATKGDKRVFLRAISDVANPFIYIDRCGFWAPWRIASGTFYTSSGNSKRHRLMNMAVVDFIKRHDDKLGLNNCNCDVCEMLREQNMVLGLEVDSLLLKLRAHAFILGDDYIAVSMGEQQDLIFDTIMDYLFGTITKTEYKPMFGSAEFLRRRFTIVNEMILPYRETTRVLAKLVHGEHRVNVERFCAAVYSAMIEAGPSKELQEILGKLVERLVPDPVALKEATERLEKKHPEIVDMLPFYRFKPEDLVNYFNRPIANLVNVLRTVRLSASEEV